MFKKAIFVLKYDGLYILAKKMLRILIGKMKVVARQFVMNYSHPKIKNNPEYNRGLNIIGSIKYTFGIAEVTRNFIRKIRESGVPVCLFNIESDHHKKIDKEEYRNYIRNIGFVPLYHKNMFFINGNFINSFYNKDPDLFKNKYNTGVWWWEFESGLDSYIDGFKYLDEVVVFSDFIKKTLEKLPHGDCKITKLKYPLVENWRILQDVKETRKKYNIKEDDFVFKFNFAYLSSYERKNPSAVLKAFAQAFPDKKDVKLILKANYCHKFKDKVNKIMNLIDELKLNEKVIIINKTISKNELMTLLNSSDCYISLHRGEGLGLGMLEAMALGKPVIASRYGGNLEFMNDENSFLVDCKMVKADDDYWAYKNVKFWADPDIEQASSYMKNLYLNRETAKEKGKIAQDSIWNLYNSTDFCNDVSKFLYS